MDNIVATLKSFVQNHSEWAPEQFQNMHDTVLRATVRAAFREPENYIENLIQNGTMAEINAFSLLVKEECPFMYVVTFAGLLDMLYTCENQGICYSRELVRWFRENGWSFPDFEKAQAKDILYSA